MTTFTKEELKAKVLGYMGDYTNTEEDFSTDSGDFMFVNSQFLGEIMNDGNIYNPYLHRRFVPARFTQLMLNGMAEDKVRFKNQYKYYLARVCVDELSKLNYLEHKNLTLEFNERNAIWGKVYEMFNKEFNIDLKSDVQSSKRYAIRKIERNTIRNYNRDNALLFDVIVDAYLKAGAYYTLKHWIMFRDNVSINGMNKQQSCKFIYGLLLSGSSYETFLGMLKKVMQESNQA